VNGPSTNASFFPLAVWLQSPCQAAAYKAPGINLYVGLWNGPTEAQLQALEKHAMPVICSLNDQARTQLNRKIIVGWMHGDEPDNAQSLGQGRGYGPPIPPSTIQTDYDQLKALDPTRISNLDTKPTPHQVKAEVWMSLIHGLCPGRPHGGFIGPGRV
jgi:hypothetical protein